MRPNQPSDVWKRVKIGEPDECWEWQGATLLGDCLPYGRMRLRGVQTYAHRVAYEAHYGEAPGPLHVLHSCDNPRCCNPAHLSLGDYEENNRQRAERGRNADIRGEKNPAHKLTNQQVAEIRDLRGKMTQRKIAEIYGVRQNQISRIQTGARR